MNRLDHLTSLGIHTPPLPTRLTGIVCTIGPACREVDQLVQMIKSGMTIARLNFSHGTHEYHSGTISNVRSAVKKYSQELGLAEHAIAIALDTKGPEIRTGLLEGDINKDRQLKTGAKIKVTTDDAYKAKCSESILYVDYKKIAKVVAPGGKIFIDDGLISLVVESVQGNDLQCVIENGGPLGSKKGVNLPCALVDLPAVSEQDKRDLIFGVEQDVDIVFASFIRNAKGVNEIRDVLGEKGKHIKIISKIENDEGVRNIDSIIAASDGIMVARGDLGIEIPTEKVFLAQKMMITKCNIAGKPVICATQMLESMVKKPRPTRAESSDVANAVLDGSDCVMLSGETAKGDYPFAAVSTMAAIAREADTAVDNESQFIELNAKGPNPCDTVTATARGAVLASLASGAVAIVALTVTGRTVHKLSQYRPRCPIIAVTPNARTARQAYLYRGIQPLIVSQSSQGKDWKSDSDMRIQEGIKYAKGRRILKPNDLVVVVTGSKCGPGNTDTFSFMTVS